MIVVLIILFLLGTLFCADICPEISVYIKDFDSCYLFNDDATQFATAEAACYQTQGHLVSLHNAFENSLLAQYADQDMRSSRAYIGLQRVTNGSWVWTDETPATYFKWGPGEPKSGDCAYLDILDRSWYAQSCSTITPYICRLMPCAPGWVLWNTTQMCYYHGRNSSFQQALGYCGYHGGSVTSVHSDAENAFIKSLVWTPECIQMGNWWAGLTMLGGTWDQAKNHTAGWFDQSPNNYSQMICTGGGLSLLTMNAFPSTCNGCGDGVWTMYGFDRVNDKLPEFVCKAPPYVIVT